MAMIDNPADKDNIRGQNLERTGKRRQRRMEDDNHEHVLRSE